MSHLRAKISALGAYVPPRLLTNQDLEKMVETSHEWIMERTGIRERHLVDQGVATSDLAAEAAKRALSELVRDLRGKYPDYGIEYEVFVTAPGAEIDEQHPMIKAIDAGHERVFGSPPERDVVRWFSDASALTRYGIETVNYGTSSGLPGPDGENLDIEGLRQIATVYALAVAEICGVAA